MPTICKNLCSMFFPLPYGWKVLTSIHSEGRKFMLRQYLRNWNWVVLVRRALWLNLIGAPSWSVERQCTRGALISIHCWSFRLLQLTTSRFMENCKKSGFQCQSKEACIHTFSNNGGLGYELGHGRNICGTM